MISLIELDSTLILFLIGVMVFSGLVHGTLGLGFPLVSTPIIAIFFDVRTAILLTLLPTVVVNIATIIAGTDYSRVFRRFYTLVIFTFLGSIVGTVLLASTDPNPFRILLAVLIFVFLGSNYLGKLPRKRLERHEFTAMLIFGSLAGLSAGTTNVMVAILLVYFLSLELSRASMVPILNTCFLAGKISQIIVFGKMEMIKITLLFETMPLAISALAALLIGQRIREHIPVRTYRRMLEVLLGALAVVLIAQYLEG